jgi:hypothetical protein
MMPKYADIRVSSEVYTSSSLDSFVDVTYRENGRLRHDEFHIQSEAFVGRYGYKKMPLYVVDEVLRLLRLMIENDTIRPYEVTPDGQRRTKSLRYFCREEIVHQAQKWPKAGAES